MITIKVDDKQIGHDNIWYHYQRKPRPGGHLYKFFIPLKERDLLLNIEKRMNVDIDNIIFANKLVNTQDSIYPIVRDVQDYLDKKHRIEEYDIKWVFNNIEKVKFKDDNIIISGVASECLDDFK